jgi:hypothetical protein
MPDIALCKSERCPVRTNCYRNEASGTEPSYARQVYAPPVMIGGHCFSYIPLDANKNFRITGK